MILLWKTPAWSRVWWFIDLANNKMITRSLVVFMNGSVNKVGDSPNKIKSVRQGFSGSFFPLEDCDVIIVIPNLPDSTWKPIERNLCNGGPDHHPEPRGRDLRRVLPKSTTLWQRLNKNKEYFNFNQWSLLINVWKHLRILWSTF